MGERDDNDRLRDGTLPPDPTADASPFGAAGSNGDGKGPPPPALDSAALHGLAGEFVRTVEPHTEADPAGLLVQFLVAFGCLVGRSPHFVVGGDHHHLNLFATLVGETAAGRKGSSWGVVRRFVRLVDESWTTPCIASGLSSGEGLIHAVRDEVRARQPLKDKEGRVIDYQDVVVDAGVADKRLLVVETEFGRPLRAMRRDTCTLSTLLREAWDRGDLRTLTREPYRATGAHIAVVGHITADELRRFLADVEVANGFANRFLWLWVMRVRCLPEGGSLEDDALRGLADLVRSRAEEARHLGRITRDAVARALWAEVYPALGSGNRGLVGALTARAEAQVLRLSCVYALLDGTSVVREPHLRAALAVWRYCEASARRIFGDALGDPLADEILQQLTTAGERGMTRTDLCNHFGRHRSADEIGRALALLRGSRLARSEARETSGRPAEVWHAV